MSHHPEFSFRTLIALAYGGLSLLLVGLAAYVARDLSYNGDFWEHAAAIRALASDLMDPPHPILNIEAAHHLFTPFHVITAVLAQASGLTATRALAFWGPVNAALFCLSIVLFCRHFIGRERAGAVSLLVLCLTLFGWGGHVWFFSGFLSIRAFAFIVPYPSATCFVLMLLALPLLDRWMASGRLPQLAGFLVAYSFVGLTHQITFVAMSVTAAAICGPKLLACPGRGFLAAMVAVLALLSILWWPYFSVIELSGNHGEFAHNNSVMFEHPAVRLFPAIICLPALFWHRRIGISPFILLSLSGLSLCYLAGYAGWQPILGRLISFIAFFGHLITATTTVYFCQKIHARFGSFGVVKRMALIPAALAGFVILLPMFNYDELVRWTRTVESQRQTVSTARLVAENLGPDEVVIAPTSISFELPAFAGRLIASRAAIAFVPDHEARRNILDALCSPQMGHEDVLDLIEEHRASKLLVPDSCTLPEFWFTSSNLRISETGAFGRLSLYDISITN